MIKEVTIAKLDTTLLNWNVKAGDSVSVKDLLCVAKLENMTREVSSKFDGVVKEILVNEGSCVPGGQVVCKIEVEDKQDECLHSIEKGIEVEVKADNIGGSKASVQEICRSIGDTIKAGETLAVVEAGKLTKDITSPYGGEIVSLNIDEYQDIEKGDVIAVILTDGTVASRDEKPKQTITVIGGGPGGYVAAIRASQLGASVNLIESNKVGGTCLNVGCIPTKALMHSAEMFLNAKNGAKSGILADNVRLDWTQVQNYRQGISDQLVDGVKGLLAANGVEYIEGFAQFNNSKTLKVKTNDENEIEIKSDKYIIATGSKPFMPPIEGLEGNDNCIDSTGALCCENRPKSLIIVGGGVIGIELACAYNAFGTKVTIIEMMDRLMPVMDLELTIEAQNIMEEKGIEFSLETRVNAFEKTENGSKVITTLKDGTEKVFEAEKVLVAVGRRSNIEGLNAEAAGIKLERGHIVVNDKLETNVGGIYAIGDCAGKIMLAHTASAMGEIAAENAMGAKNEYNQRVVPSCVYMFPEFAAVGLTEEQVKAKGYPYKVGKFPMIANGKSLIMEETQGLVKIISDERSGKLLGVHILGARATDLISEAAVVMQMYGGVNDIINTIHSHPTVSEAVHEAALDVEGRAIHYK